MYCTTVHVNSNLRHHSLIRFFVLPTNSSCTGTLSASLVVNRIPKQTVLRALFSTSTESSSTSVENRLYKAALDHVPTHGWTKETIAAAIRSANLPVSMVGRLTPQQLVAEFMNDSNRRFRDSQLDYGSDQGTIQQRLFVAIRARLEYVVPYLSTWHEGMAIGATQQTFTTREQLQELVQLIADKVVEGTDHPPLNQLQRTAVGAVYVATELHLLSSHDGGTAATTNAQVQDSWEFLRERVDDLHNIQNIGVSGNTVVAASAVASSLVGAVISLAQPAAGKVAQEAAATLVPTVMSILQPSFVTTNAAYTNTTTTTESAPPPGSRAEDYDDLPPFPNEK